MTDISYSYDIKPKQEDIDQDKIFSNARDAEKWVDTYEQWEDCSPGYIVIKWENRFYVVFRASLSDDIYYCNYNWEQQF